MGIPAYLLGMAIEKRVLVQLGESCQRDPRIAKKEIIEVFTPHEIVAPEDDAEFQAVFRWLRQKEDLARLMTSAVDDAVTYVLDGPRTGRFDLNAPEVDSDERSSVGTKLQYYVINELGLLKVKPLDTVVEGVPVELKATVNTNWMIPTEGQCQICLLTQVDTKKMRHRALLMRTHRAWLNAPNKDLKRSIQASALDNFALTVLDWTPLPAQPLRLLELDQLAVVFDANVGLKRRATALFGYLPNTVIPRTSMETLGAGLKDPMRRIRQCKPDVLREYEMTVLCGKWENELSSGSVSRLRHLGRRLDRADSGGDGGSRFGLTPALIESEPGADQLVANSP